MVVSGLTINETTKKRMETSQAELLGEREIAFDILKIPHDE